MAVSLDFLVVQGHLELEERRDDVLVILGYDDLVLGGVGAQPVDQVDGPGQGDPPQGRH